MVNYFEQFVKDELEWICNDDMINILLEGFDGEITEDELKNAETEIQKLTDKSIEEIDKILANKETEIMSV